MGYERGLQSCNPFLYKKSDGIKMMKNKIKNKKYK